jgi:hypothetical protein
VQSLNWWLLYLTYQEDIPLHAEPGNIFKTNDGINMKDIDSIDSTPEQVIEELDFVEITTLDSEGNRVTTKVY